MALIGAAATNESAAERMRTISADQLYPVVAALTQHQPPALRYWPDVAAW